MKKHILFFLLFITHINLAFSQNNVIDEVAWIIGDEAILKSDIEEQRIRLLYEMQEAKEDLYCLIPEELAIQKLLIHQAKIDSVTVSENIVVQQVDQRLDYFIQHLGSKERLEEQFNKSLYVLREEMMELIEEQMIAQQMKQKIVENIKVTPSEVRNFYTNIPTSELPTIESQSEIQIISIDPIIAKEEIESIKNKLQSYKERIESGEIDFSTLAILYSEDPESARKGGELGFMGKGMLVPEFANVAFSLTNTQKVSKIVETEFGYHIIQLIEKRGDKFNFRHILLKPQVSLIEKNKVLNQLDSIAGKIREEKLNFEEAVAKYSSDKNTRMNRGLMLNMQTGDSKFELAHLPVEIKNKVNNMKVGEISDPFIIKDLSGKETLAIIKLKSKTKTHTANLEEDYQIIKAALENQKQEEAFKKWIQNKQKETYIKINPNWNQCEFKYPGWKK